MFQSFTKQIIKFSVEIERKTLLGIFILQIGHHQTTSIRSYRKFQSKENFDKYCGFVAISTIDTRLALNSFVRFSLKSTFIVISVQEILLQTRFHATRKLNFQTSYKPSILVAWLLAIRLFSSCQIEFGSQNWFISHQPASKFESIPPFAISSSVRYSSRALAPLFGQSSCLLGLWWFLVPRFQGSPARATLHKHA